MKKANKTLVQRGQALGLPLLSSKWLMAAAYLSVALPQVSTAQVTAGPRFRQQPLSQSACTGKDVTLHVEIDGPYDSLAWFHEGSLIPGATGKSLVIQDFDPAEDAGSYYCLVSDAAGLASPSQPAVVAAADGSIGVFPATRYGGPNPWCPLCPHPPIIDPLRVMAPGTTTVIDLGESQGAAVRFDQAQVDTLASSPGPETFTFAVEGTRGSVRQEFGQVKAQKRDGVGLPWWLWPIFDTLSGLQNQRVVVLSGGVVIADLPLATDAHVETPFFPDAVSNVSKKFDWAPKLEGGKEGYSLQFRQNRPVTIGARTYQADEIQFLASRSSGQSQFVFGTTSYFRIGREHLPNGVSAPTLSVATIRSGGTQLPASRVSKVDSFTMKQRVTASYDMAKGKYTVHPPGPDMEPDLLPYSPAESGPPLVLRSDAADSSTGAAALLLYTSSQGPYQLSATDPSKSVWNECATPPAQALAGSCVYQLTGTKWSLSEFEASKAPALRFTATGTFSDGQSRQVCELQQVRQTNAALPVRLHFGYDLADFTLEVRHQGQLRASWPCAGGPVINLPDWLKDIKIESKTIVSGTGVHFPKVVLTARFGEPLPQPWACNLEVNGQVVQGDELIFTREDLPAPAPPAPIVATLSEMAVGGGGIGTGKVQFQDFHFTRHAQYAVGEALAFCPQDSAGLRYTRGLPPDFDDGSTVFDPFGPQPQAYGIIPTTNGNAIKTKGTGYSRIMPLPLPPVSSVIGGPVVPQPVGLLLPAVQKVRLLTSVQYPYQLNAARLVAPATVSAEGAMSTVSVAFGECDAWDVELAPLMAPGTSAPEGSSFTLTAYGTVALTDPTGETEQTGYSLGSLTATLGAAAPNGDQPATLTPNFSALASPDHRIRIKNRGALVFERVARGEACTLSRLPRRWGKLGGTTECFVGGDPVPFFVMLPGVAAAPIAADEVEILVASVGAGGAPHVKAKTMLTCTGVGFDALALGSVLTKQTADEGELAVENVERSKRSAINGSNGTMVSTFLPGDPDFDLLRNDGYIIGDEQCDDGDALFLDGIVSPRDPASGQATGKRTFVVPHVFEQSRGVSMFCDCPQDGLVSINAAGALGGTFSLTRADQSGPDCGVQAVIAAYYKVRSPILGGTFTGGPGTINLQRTSSNACVIAPDFTGFGGELEVMSWSFGASNPTSIGSSGLSHGRFPVSGLQLTSPVWPANYGAACVAEGVLIGDIVWVNFPVPTEISIGGTTHTIGRLAFLARPTQPLGTIGVSEIRMTTLEAAKVSLQDFHFVMPPPVVDFSQAADGSLMVNSNSRHSVFFNGSNLGDWSVVSDYDIVKNADGSICHHLAPPSTSTRAFYQALGVWKGWDGTIKGR